MTDKSSVSVHTERQRILRNIGANYIGAVINAALPLVTLPIYFNALGAENWGLVSFVTLFVSILSILDAGLNQALVKEFATRATNDVTAHRSSADLLFGYERIYIVFALTVTLVAMAAYGITVDDLGGRKRAVKGRKAKSAKPGKGAKAGKKAASDKTAKPRKPVAAKYRDTASKATWSGRGRVPRWLAAHEAAGRKREEFAV